MTWREAVSYVKGLPDSCRVAEAMHGQIVAWGVTDVILADIFDVLAQANWQRGGNKNAPRPNPYPRPRSKKALEALGNRLRLLKDRGTHG